jgi:chromosome segregation ATPase
MFTQQTLGTAWEQVRRRGPAKDRTRPLDLDEFSTLRQREAMARAESPCVVPPSPPPPPPKQQQPLSFSAPQQPQQMMMMGQQLSPGPWSTPEYMAQIELMEVLACQESNARMQYLNGVNGLVVILQQDVTMKTAMILSLTEENTDLKRMIALRPPPPSEDVQGKVASLEAKVASLEVELAKRQAEVVELEEQNHTSAMRSVGRLGEIEELKAKLLAAVNANSSATPTQVATNEEVVRVQAELDRARAAVSWMESKHSELVVDLDCVRDKLKKAEDEGGSLKLANSLLHQSLEAKTGEFKRVTAELAQVKASRKEDGELTALNDKVTGLSERNRTLKRDLSEYKVQLTSTLEECKLRDRANKESARRVEEQNCRISFLQRQLEEANAKVSRVQQERMAKVGAINELWVKAVETAADIETQPDLARMHVELVMAKEELAKSQSHCQTLMTLNRRLMSGI